MVSAELFPIMQVHTEGSLPTNISVDETRANHKPNHTVKMHLLTKSHGRLQLLLDAEDDIINWLETIATASLVK